MAVCGPVEYFVSTSPTGDAYISFDDIDLINVDSDRPADETVSVTISAANWYSSLDLVTSDFDWVDCTQQIPQAGTYTGTTPELMFDYQSITTTEVVDMTGRDYLFSQTYCYTNAWKVTCTDPEGYSWSLDTFGNEDGDYDNRDRVWLSRCRDKVVPQLYLSGQLLNSAVVPYKDSLFSFGTLASEGYQVSSLGGSYL